jgi:hypothetical protein
MDNDEKSLPNDEQHLIVISAYISLLKRAISNYSSWLKRGLLHGTIRDAMLKESISKMGRHVLDSLQNLEEDDNVKPETRESIKIQVHDVIQWPLVDIDPALHDSLCRHLSPERIKLNDVREDAAKANEALKEAEQKLGDIENKKKEDEVKGKATSKLAVVNRKLSNDNRRDERRKTLKRVITDHRLDTLWRHSNIKSPSRFIDDGLNRKLKDKTHQDTFRVILQELQFLPDRNILDVGERTIRKDLRAIRFPKTKDF